MEAQWVRLNTTIYCAKFDLSVMRDAYVLWIRGKLGNGKVGNGKLGNRKIRQL